jgi:hypothetical protein
MTGSASFNEIRAARFVEEAIALAEQANVDKRKQMKPFYNHKEP